MTLELEALGARHVGYGILPEHYPIIVLAAVGGQRWTPSYSAAWAGLYALVEEAMLCGAATTAAGTGVDRA